MNVKSSGAEKRVVVLRIVVPINAVPKHQLVQSFVLIMRNQARFAFFAPELRYVFFCILVMKIANLDLGRLVAALLA